MNKHTTIIAALLFSAALMSCGSKQGGKIDSDDIENPANAAQPDAKKATGPLGTPVFDDTVFNFNRVVDGETVAHRYKFKNTGKGDLLIRDAHGSCGCTTTGYTKEVIPPGGEGYVDASFNSSGRGSEEGMLNEKMITVNFEQSSIETVILKFKANVFSTKSNSNN